MKRSEKFWDRLSHNFDQTAKNDTVHYRESIENVRKYLDGSESVLDLGCATGIITLEIAENVKEVQGIDISSKMIAAANKKAGERIADYRKSLSGKEEELCQLDDFPGGEVRHAT